MGNSYTLYKRIVIISTIVTIIVSVIMPKSDEYEFICCIPAFYLFMFICCSRFHKNSKEHLGLFLLNLIMYIKYVVTNLLLVLSQDYQMRSYYRVVLEPKYYYQAEVLIVLEMLAVFLTVELLSNSFYKDSFDRKTNECKFSPYKPGIVVKIFIAFCVLLLVIFPNEFIKETSILFTSENILTNTIEVNNFLSIVFKSFKIIIFGLLINHCIVKFQEKELFRYVLMSYVLIALFSYLSVSESRLNIFMPFFLFFVITQGVFRKKGLVLNISAVAMLILVFSIVTVYRTPWAYTRQSSVILILKNTMGIQEYTSGMLPTAIGAKYLSTTSDHITLITLFNDIFGSVPVLSRYINQQDRMYYYYNVFALGGSSMSQLVPMTICSIAYFTVVFPCLLVVLLVIILMKIESLRTRILDDYLNKYLNAYLYFIFASCIISNIQMLSGRFFITFLPPAIIIFIDRLVQNRGKILIRSKCRKMDSNG